MSPGGGVRSESRSRHCTSAWETEQDSISPKKKKKKEKEKKKEETQSKIKKQNKKTSKQASKQAKDEHDNDIEVITHEKNK